MKLTINPNFEREIERQPRYKAAMAEQAQEVARRARRTAPRGPTGRYHESISAIGDIVFTDDFAGHLVEWGNYHHPHPYATLRLAAKSAGLRLHELPKP